MIIAELRDKFFAKAAEQGGTTCCVCGKHGQIYRRKFNSMMARSLIMLYNANKKGEQWVDLIHYAAKEHGEVIGDYGKLEWWGLARRSQEDPENGGKTNPLYKITPKGQAFVHKAIKIPSHAVEYRSNVREFTGDDIDIDDALGKHFDYHELMSA